MPYMNNDFCHGEHLLNIKNPVIMSNLTDEYLCHYVALTQSHLMHMQFAYKSRNLFNALIR